MKWSTFLPLVVAVLCRPVAFTVPTSGHADEVSAPVFVSQIPPGYRDWRLISMAHEEGNLNDFRAIMGNDTAIKTFREGRLPFPDGTIIVRIAWNYITSEENNKAFGRRQSFVPGVPTDSYLQVIVKDPKKYAATGGWGYGQFNKDGKPAAEATLKTCFPCHEASRARDFVFTRYTP
jgi:Cytochrome P460